MLKLTSLSLEDAKRLIHAAEVKAATIGSPSNIAIVDAGGNLLAHVRMDGAQIASISLNRPGFSRHLASSLRNVFQTLPVTADC